MKKIILAVAIIGAYFTEAAAQTQYKVVTVVESIVPMGLGRSRIIEATTELEYEQFTTERNEGKDGGKQAKVKRGDAKIEGMRETKLLNFYSGLGLNFQNIASNDALVTSMINTMAQNGWEVHSVSSGVESAGYKDNAGIFITRYLFKK
jgi:hypothetical protein